MSLDLIPGHKYSTYDGGRKLRELDSSSNEDVLVDGPKPDEHQCKAIGDRDSEQEAKAAGEEEVKQLSANQPETIKKRSKKIDRSNRPISGSVSDFLIMGTETRENANQNQPQDFQPTVVKNESRESSSPVIVLNNIIKRKL